MPSLLVRHCKTTQDNSVGCNFITKIACYSQAQFLKDNQERAVCIAARGSREGRQKKLQRDDSLLAEALQSKKFHSHKPEILCYH